MSEEREVPVKPSPKKTTSYTFHEVRTREGQLVELEIPSDVDKDKLKEFFEENIRVVKLPVSHRTNLDHGAYGMYTRFDIEQLKYAGGGGPGCGGYIEAIHIKEAPDNRCCYVLFENDSGAGNHFWEYETKDELLKAFEKGWSSRRENVGFTRKVNCKGLQPWFYATGDQHIVGDFVLPDEYLSSDPSYQPGNKVVVKNNDGMEVKEVLVAREWEYEKKNDYWSGDGKTKLKKRLVVLFTDLTCYDSYYKSMGEYVRPAILDEKWALDAFSEMKEILEGKKKSGKISFQDGGALNIRYNPKEKMVKGIYVISITYKNSKGRVKKLEDRRINFDPKEFATIKERITPELNQKNCELISIDKLKKEGRDYTWRGIYKDPYLGHE